MEILINFIHRARRIAKYLLRNEVLVYLDLSNNELGYDGSRYLSQALKINKTLKCLNLRLNGLSDKAGMKFFQDLIYNRGIKELNLSGNSLEYMVRAVPALTKM